MFVVLGAVAILFVRGLSCHGDHPLLLLVSFDGFRWDYLERVKCEGLETPNFDYLIKNGVFVNNGVKNAYITKTFPNHYSIVTGLYEESHGVIANEMYDPKANRHFSISNPEDITDAFWFDNGTDEYSGFPEPIWLTNERPHGKFERHSGVMFWPGSEAKGMTASRYEKYDKTLPNKTRIDNVVSWFATEDKPINLGLVYFSEPDHSGHIYGPNSDVIPHLIVELDELVGYLIQQLEEAKLMHKMNIIITSDHGMAPVNDVIELDHHVDESLYEDISSGPVWNILPADGKDAELLEALGSIANLTVYKKEDIPTHYHYAYNRRIMPIVIEADIGFNICKNRSYECDDKGVHGFNNGLSAMHPIFIASGPAFKKNYVSNQFNNVDIYELMCHILKVKPAPNNGSLDNIKQVLYVEQGLTLPSATFMLSIVFCALVAVIFCINTARLHIASCNAMTSRVTQNPLVALKSVRIEQNSALLNSSSEDEFD